MSLQFPPRFVRRSSIGTKALLYAKENLNFYRIHLIVFTITPLVFSAIMYGCNGEYPIAYIDCLFNCVSAMTVTGLATVNLSQLTGWQQAIIFIQMSAGNIVTVSWVMVLVRKYFFRTQFENFVKTSIARKDAEEGRTPRLVFRARPWRRKIWAWAHKRVDSEHEPSKDSGTPPKKHKQKDDAPEKLRTDMIRRVPDAPRLVNPMGRISEKNEADPLDSPVDLEPEGGLSIESTNEKTAAAQPHSMPTRIETLESLSATTSRASSIHRRRRLSDPGRSSPFSNANIDARMTRYPTLEPSQDLNEKRVLHPSPPIISPPRTPVSNIKPAHANFPRTQTIEFAQPDPLIARRGRKPSAQTHRTTENDASDDESSRERKGKTIPLGAPTRSLPRTTTNYTTRSGAATHTTAARSSGFPRTTTGGDIGFGGFPMPHIIIGRIVDKMFPSFSRRIQRTVSVPAGTTTVTSQIGAGTTRTGLGMTDGRTKSVTYISFDAIVGRNSHFHGLTTDELEELGGVEYRALLMLLWLVPIYHFGVQLIPFCVIAPYMALNQWKPIFDSQIRYLPTSWYSIFVITSAYTNNGMSLVDQSLMPFQAAYPKLVFLFIVILAGNTAYPVFFRLMIWMVAKVVPTRSRANETLQFLLDHPRRCFVYLFPSHETWFLLTFVAVLTLTDWVSFLVVDIGNPEINGIPIGRRMLDGLVQSAAVRAAGFSVVNLSTLAPAVKVLYVIMMYVSVYPIALAVRSTNVYEERSLGVLDEGDDGSNHEPDAHGPRVQVWGAYLAWHARKQLAFDMWWLGLAVVIVCVIERGQINDFEKGSIDIFPIIFEIVSAYGTVGMSLGLSDQNYSLSGAFSPLSKLIISAVMLRGRHRGLPVAIDRAVMIPDEYSQNNNANNRAASQDVLRSRMSEDTRRPRFASPERNDDRPHVQRSDSAENRGVSLENRSLNKYVTGVLTPVPESIS